MKLETRKMMKTQSAKAKGRKLQQWFTKLLIEVLGLDKEDMESRPMGSQGEDIIMGNPPDKKQRMLSTDPYVSMMKE